MKLGDLPEHYRQQAEQQLKTAKQHNAPHVGEYSFIANEAHRPPPRPEPEQVVRHEPLEKNAGEKSNPTRRRISITSYRRRLLDEDNLCGKYFVDSLRYFAVIQDDSPDQVAIAIQQIKVKTKDEERTEIEIL